MRNPATNAPELPRYAAWWRPQALFADAPAHARFPWGWAAPVLAIVFVVITGLPVELALDQLMLYDANGNLRDAWALAAFLVAPFSLLGGLVLVWTTKMERRPLACIGLTSHRRLRTFLFGYAIGLTMVIALVLAIWACGGYIAGGLGPAWSSPRALASIAMLLLCFAVQASVEEILFRGWLLSVVARRYGPAIAVILSTLVFTLLHFDRQQAVAAATMTILFSAVTSMWALSTRNIWGVMGWHAGWNWLIAVGFGVPITGIDAHLPALLVAMTPVGATWLTGGAGGPENSALSMLLLGLGLFGIGLSWKRRQPQPVNGAGDMTDPRARSNSEQLRASQELPSSER